MTSEFAIGGTGRQIASALRADIIRGVLKPGERIAQDAVAERFRASRIPVRDALNLLESEGLVTVVPNSGAWVAKLRSSEFHQIYRLREQVEALAIRESIDGLTFDQLARLRELTEEVRDSPDVETFLRLDREFHLLTYAGAVFPLLHDLVERFWNSTQHYRRAFAATRSDNPDWRTDSEHRLIVDAIERRDYEAAGNLVSGHIRRTRLILEARPELFD